MATLLLIGSTLVGLGFSLKKDRNLTLKTLISARKMMGGMLSDIVGILLLIGLMLAWLPPHVIQKYVGEASGFLALFMAGFFGTITLIPAFVAFPLIGSLRDNGAGIMTLTAFLTTLTMVGFITFPLEKKTFGFKFAFVRNSLSFIFALIIAFLVGGIMS